MDVSNYFEWLAQGTWIRITARAIIFNEAEDHILIEENLGPENIFYNFIGGGVEVGESLQSCIEREFREEVEAEITLIEYGFLCENFYLHEGEIRHAHGHYFVVKLDRPDVKPKESGVNYHWLPIAELKRYDLRPVAVRDAIADGSYRSLTHLVTEPE